MPLESFILRRRAPEPSPQRRGVLCGGDRNIFSQILPVHLMCTHITTLTHRAIRFPTYSPTAEQPLNDSQNVEFSFIHYSYLGKVKKTMALHSTDFWGLGGRERELLPSPSGSAPFATPFAVKQTTNRALRVVGCGIYGL